MAGIIRVRIDDEAEDIPPSSVRLTISRSALVLGEFIPTRNDHEPDGILIRYQPHPRCEIEQVFPCNDFGLSKNFGTALSLLKEKGRTVQACG